MTRPTPRMVEVLRLILAGEVLCHDGTGWFLDRRGVKGPRIHDLTGFALEEGDLIKALPAHGVITRYELTSAGRALAALRTCPRSGSSI